MPLYEIEGPDKRTYTIEGPAGATLEQLVAVIKQQGLDLPPTAPRQSTITGEAKRGLEQLVSGTVTGVGAITGSPEEAARRGLERGERIATEAGEGPSFERLQRIFQEKGFLEAGKAALGDVPRVVAGQLPQLGAMAAGAKLGAMTGTAAAPFLGPAAPAAPVIGGGLGALAALAPSVYGQMIERQAAEQQQRGEPIDIQQGRAAAATAGSLALEVGGTAMVAGKALVKKVLGVANDPLLATRTAQEGLVAAANRSLAGYAGRGAVVEMPVEVAQTVIERAQAGLSVTDDEAFKEYGEAAYLGGIAGGALGGAGGVSSRGAARRSLAAQEELDRTAREMGPPVPGPEQMGPPEQPPAQAEMFERPRQTQVEEAPSAEQLGADMAERREAFDRLQRENQRLKAQYDQETDPAKKAALYAEAEKLAPQLRAVSQELKDLRKVTPKDAPGARRPTTPEGQFELPLTDGIRLQDLPNYGIPIEGGSPAIVGVRGWLRDNVLGKTPEQVRRMTEKQPDLLQGKGLRARVLKEMIAPQPQAFQQPMEAPSEPRTESRPAEQPELDFGGAEPSVGVSGEPAAVPAGRVEPTEQPEGAEPTGLGGGEPPAAGRVSPEVGERGALGARVAAEEWDEFKPENAPTYEQLPLSAQSEWAKRATRPTGAVTIQDADEVFDAAIREVGFQAHSFSETKPKDAPADQMFADTTEGRVAKAFYDALPEQDKKRVERERDTFAEQKRSGSAARTRFDEEKKRKTEEEKEYAEAEKERQREEAKRKKAEEKEPPKPRRERRAEKFGTAKPAEKPAEKPAKKPAEKPAEKPSRIQGTSEQKQEAQNHANDLGGSVVWQDGDYSLVRGYSGFTGKPLYSGTNDTTRTAVDIERFTGDFIPKEVVREMIAVKKELEKEAADKHASDPFIKFDKDGVALSQDIPAEYEGIIREWKKLLKLDANVYISTIEDARKNKENFTGPHRAIGSGTLSSTEGGSIRKMDDNTYYILFEYSPKKTKNLEILAHEMGHLHQRLFFDSATTAEQDALRKAHADWLESTKGKTAKDLIESMRGRATADVDGDLSYPSESLPRYWRSFSEWYADQTARWAMSADKPTTIVEKFFARLGAALRNFYNTLKAKKYLPNETFAQYIEATISRPDKLDLQPVSITRSENFPLDWILGYAIDAKDDSAAKDDRAASAMVTSTTGATPPPLQKGFSPVPGGLNKVTADSVWEGILKLRTQLADKGAYVFDRIAKGFNDEVNTALKGKQVEAGFRQAEASDQFLPQFFRLGAMRKDKTSGQWEAINKDGIKPPAEIIDYVREYAEANDMSFDAAYKEVSDILQAAREHTFREHNATRPKGAQAMPRHMPDDEVDRLYPIYKSDATIKKIVKTMDKVRFDLIDHLVDVGRIPKELGQEWKDASNYVPFDRLVDLGTKPRTPQKRTGRGIGQLGKLPELVDAELVSLPPKNTIDNYFGTIGWMARQVIQQDATLRTLRALEDIGEAKLLSTRILPRQMADRVASTYINGEERYFEVASPYHKVAFNMMSAPTLPIFRVFQRFSQVLRHAITAVPTFTAAQLPQDIQRAIMYSGVQNPAALTAKVLANFKDFSKAAVLGKLADVAPELGTFGVVGGVDFHMNDPTKTFLTDMGVYKDKLLGSTKFATLLKRLEGIAMASDIAMRKAIYDQTLEETQGDRLQALTRAREIINFRRFGAGDKLGLLHLATQTVPFYNAYLQGTDVLFRSLTGKNAVSGLERNAALKHFYKNVGYLMAASTVYAMMMADEEDYENMDLRERDKTWVIGGGIGIPVASELGVLFKAIPERVVEYYRKAGTPEEAVAMEAIIAHFKTGIASEYFGRAIPIPVAIKPMLEVWTNYSFLTGRELEGISQKQLDASERVTSRTSELAKSVAQFAAKSTNGFVQISPIAIDTVLQGYLGTTASLSMAVADQALNPNRADRPLHQIVGATPFAYDPVGTRRSSEFYELREKVVQSQNTLNRLIKQDPDRAAEYYERNAERLALYKMVNSTLQQLEDSRKYKQWLDTEMAAETMSSAERMKMKQEVQAYEQKLVEWVRDAKNEMKL